jgi:Cytochrome c oxidase subunit IV
MSDQPKALAVETRLFLGLAIFFFIVGAVYWVLSAEPVGIAGLILVGFFALLISFFTWYTGRQVDPRPEDDGNGEISDMAGDYGTFSPHSWWPLILGAASAVTGLGIIFGWWMFILGAVGLIFACIGLVFEYYRGPFAEEPH